MTITADYSSPDLSKHFQVDTADKSLVNTHTDRDAPKESSTTKLGELRTKTMIMQQNINIFLTERMKQSAKVTVEEEELEKKILDGDEGIDEDDEDEDE